MEQVAFTATVIASTFQTVLASAHDFRRELYLPLLLLLRRLLLLLLLLLLCR